MKTINLTTVACEESARAYCATRGPIWNLFYGFKGESLIEYGGELYAMSTWQLPVEVANAILDGESV